MRFRTINTASCISLWVLDTKQGVLGFLCFQGFSAFRFGFSGALLYLWVKTEGPNLS